MTTNEAELINIIRNHENPTQAFDIALSLMLDFLALHEAPQDTFAETPRVTA